MKKIILVLPLFFLVSCNIKISSSLSKSESFIVDSSSIENSSKESSSEKSVSSDTSTSNSKESTLSSSSIKESSSKESVISSSVDVSSSVESSSEISSSSVSSSISSSSSEVILNTSYTLDSSNSPLLVNETSYFSLSIDNKTLIYDNASSYANGHITINDKGSIKNSTKLEGFYNIKIDYVGGSLKFYYGFANYNSNSMIVENANQLISLDNNYNYFKVEAIGNVSINSISFNMTGYPTSDYQYINIYDDNYNLISTKEYKIGSSVDVSSLPTLENKYYEDKVINFLGYGIEEDSEILTSLTMPNKSLGLYPIYEDVQRFSFDHDYISHTYTSFKKGVRVVSEVEGKQYGRFSADFKVTDLTCTSVDLLFNLTLGPNSYPYEVNDGSSYYAIHTNPNTGGFQLACDYKSEEFTGWKVLKTVTKASNPYWSSYYDNWYNNGNPTNPLEFRLTAEFTPVSISFYVNDSFLGCTTKTEDLNLLSASNVGIRANYKGVEVSNFEFVEYISSNNGFNKYKDGSYISYGSGCSTTIDGISGKYGKFETTITCYNAIQANSRLGVIARAKYDETLSGVWATSGYYVHHNQYANANFTLSTIYNNAYQGRPNIENNNTNILGVSYSDTTIDEPLKSYYELNGRFNGKKLPNYSFKLAIEIRTNKIVVYLNDVEIITVTDSDSLTIFDELENNGVGIISQVAGSKFTGMEWTAYED